ncbi:MAG: hypothetical protein SGJ20_06235 [Planctomycetota bacterium]|nr:hypothetical protein [Planctomycetota bacterium]
MNIRRYFRFSLRTGLVLVTLAAVQVGIGTAVWRYEEERLRIYHELEQNCNVLSDMNPRSWVDESQPDTISPGFWRSLLPARYHRMAVTVRGLNSRQDNSADEPVADFDFRDLIYFPEIEELWISEGTELQLLSIPEVPELCRLALTDQTSVTNKVILHVVDMAPGVEDLIIEGNLVTDDSIPAICQLKKLRHLHLSDTNITVEGLRKLQSLTSLEEVVVSSEIVTDADIEKLKAVIPIQ